MSALPVLLVASSLVFAADAPRPALPLVLKWTVDIPGPPVAGAAPVSDNSHVYVALRTGQIIARSSADGAQAWQRDLATERPLAVDGGLLFVAGAGAIHALRGTDGAIAWEAPIAGVTAPLLAHGGWLIALSGGKALAYRASDGTLVWQRDVGVANMRPAIDGDRLYVSTDEGRVLAMELTSGEPIWEQRLGVHPTEPFAWFGYVYVGSGDRQFYCLKAKDGEIAWRWRVGPILDTSATADDSRVYFVGLDNVLRALDRVTGVQQWQVGLKRRAASGPVVMQKWVLVPSSTSAEIWIWTAEGRSAALIPTPAEPAVVPDFTENPTGTANVYVITGSLARVWQLTLVETAGDPPAVALTDLPGTPVSVELPRQ